MKINEKKKTKIINAIKELELKESDLDSISIGNMEKICKLANVKNIELMWYLRYER